MIRKSGFTLIELLVVVAIIGILAAIAVPNFTNALIRADVSRVLADHRTINTAVQQYALDNNLPPGAPMYSGLRLYNFAERFHALTTPVAYLGSIPQDPFPKRSKREMDQTLDFRHEVPGASAYGYFRADNSGPGGQYDFGIHRWMVSSSGPDGLMEYFAYYPQSETEGEEMCAICQIDAPGILLVATQYSPSNGLVSSGDLMRWGSRH